jgi:hypothetical protein
VIVKFVYHEADDCWSGKSAEQSSPHPVRYLTTHPILHASVLDSWSHIRRHNPCIDTWPDMGRIETILK